MCVFSALHAAQLRISLPVMGSNAFAVGNLVPRLRDSEVRRSDQQEESPFRDEVRASQQCAGRSLNPRLSKARRSGCLVKTCSVT